MTKDMVLGAVRTLLSALGGAYGIQAGLTGQDVDAAAGAIVVLISLGWSIYDKYARKRAGG